MELVPLLNDLENVVVVMTKIVLTARKIKNTKYMFYHCI